MTAGGRAPFAAARSRPARPTVPGARWWFRPRRSALPHAEPPPPPTARESSRRPRAGVGSGVRPRLAGARDRSSGIAARGRRPVWGRWPSPHGQAAPARRRSPRTSPAPAPGTTSEGPAPPPTARLVRWSPRTPPSSSPPIRPHSASGVPQKTPRPTRRGVARCPGPRIGPAAGSLPPTSRPLPSAHPDRARHGLPPMLGPSPPPRQWR